MASTLPRGLSKAGELCPFCGGGSTSERSLSVTRDPGGALLYCCHRNSCQACGRIEDYGDNVKYTAGKPPKVFTKPTRALTEAQLRFFSSTYDIQPEEIGRAQFLYIPDLKSVWQPVFGPKGERRGGVVRSYSTKKIASYQELEGAWLAWYRKQSSGSITDGIPPSECLVIVEDQLSALKVSRHYDCVALLGTYMGPEKLAEIIKYTEVAGVKHGSQEPTVVLLLDADAYSTALGYWIKYSPHFGNFYVRNLSNKDPKYWDDGLLKEIVI